MPKQNEKARKLRILRAGGNVRPPKKFWDRMLRIINKEYPNKSKTARARILGGVWNKYTTQDKINIVKEFQS